MERRAFLGRVMGAAGVVSMTGPVLSAVTGPVEVGAPVKEVVPQTSEATRVVIGRASAVMTRWTREVLEDTLRCLKGQVRLGLDRASPKRATAGWWQANIGVVIPWGASLHEVRPETDLMTWMAKEGYRWSPAALGSALQITGGHLHGVFAAQVAKATRCGLLPTLQGVDGCSVVDLASGLCVRGITDYVATTDQEIVRFDMLLKA
jgi:hypothetical protein